MPAIEDLEEKIQAGIQKGGTSGAEFSTASSSIGIFKDPNIVLLAM